MAFKSERCRDSNKETDRHKPSHKLIHRWEQSEGRALGGERERVTRPGSKEETDMEPKPPSEPTPRKDRDLSV